MTDPRRSFGNPPPWHPLWSELKIFLGDAFRYDWANDEDVKVFEEAARYPDVKTFYRDSDILMYQGVAYFLHGWKRKYHSIVLQLGLGALQILDFGCGTGHDGMTFLHYGHRVTFADLDGRSLAFCRWRLQQWGYDAQVISLKGDIQLPYNHIVWCADVIEHLPPAEQAGLLTTLGQLGRIVIVNLIDDKRADGAIHYPVDREALTAHVETLWPGKMLAQDVYVMQDGNAVRLLLYGAGVAREAGGGMVIDPHGTGEFTSGGVLAEPTAKSPQYADLVDLSNAQQALLAGPMATQRAAIAERLMALYHDAEQEAVHIRQDSLAQCVRFFRHCPELSTPRMTLTPKDTLRVHWRTGTPLALAIEFTGTEEVVTHG